MKLIGSLVCDVQQVRSVIFQAGLSLGSLPGEINPLDSGNVPSAGAALIRLSKPQLTPKFVFVSQSFISSGLELRVSVSIQRSSCLKPTDFQLSI